MGNVYIYRSGDGNLFKVGKATDVERRVKTHATGNPEPFTRFDVIETDDPSKCETFLKHRLRTKRSTRSDGTEWFEVDPAYLSVVVAEARRYTDEVLPMIAEAERLSEEQCDDRVLPPTDEALQTYQRLVKVREDYDTLGYEKDHLEAKLKLTIGNASGIEGVANWKTVSKRVFDTDEFKDKEPDLYQAFLREQRSRRLNLL